MSTVRYPVRCTDSISRMIILKSLNNYNLQLVTSTTLQKMAGKSREPKQRPRHIKNMDEVFVNNVK